MSRTLRFGTHQEPRLVSRIDRFVIRRRTGEAFDAHAELAYQFAMSQSLEEAKRDLHSRAVAREVSASVSPQPRRIVGGIPAKPFGKRES